MNEEFYRFSTVTGKKYNYFDTVRIINLKQCIKYMENGVFPVDIKVEENSRTNEKCMIFYFDKEESREVFDKWCKYEL